MTKRHDPELEAVMSQMLRSPDPAFRRAGEIVREHLNRELRPKVLRIKVGDRYAMSGGRLTSQGTRGAATWDNAGPAKLHVKSNEGFYERHPHARVVTYELVPVAEESVEDFMDY